MHFINEDPLARVLRRLAACTHTLYAVVEELEDLEEEEVESHEARADLLVSVESFFDVAMHITEEIRAIAWQYSLTPQQLQEDRDGPDQEDY